jgi:hypothetical protein
MSGIHFYPDIIVKFKVWGDNFREVESYANKLGIPVADKTQLGDAWAPYINAQELADAPLSRSKINVEEANGNGGHNIINWE